MNKYEVLIREVATGVETPVAVLQAESIIEAQKEAVRTYMLAKNFNMLKQQVVVRSKKGSQK